MDSGLFQENDVKSVSDELPHLLPSIIVECVYVLVAVLSFLVLPARPSLSIQSPFVVVRVFIDIFLVFSVVSFFLPVGRSHAVRK